MSTTRHDLSNQEHTIVNTHILRHRVSIAVRAGGGQRKLGLHVGTAAYCYIVLHRWSRSQGWLHGLNGHRHYYVGRKVSFRRGHSQSMTMRLVGCVVASRVW